MKLGQNTYLHNLFDKCE